MPFDPNIPLTPADAKARARTLLAEGRVLFCPHADERAKERNLTTGDIRNVLKGGVFEPAELVQGGVYRYQARTNAMSVVVEFGDEDLMIIVTAWRMQK